MVPTNKNTLQGDYTKKDRDTLTLSGGQYQEPLPEVQDYPTDQIVPPVLENTPGREFVLGGEVQLDHTPSTTSGIRATRNKLIST